MLNFTTTDAVTTGAGIKCLIYGKAGVGKTYLLRTAPSPLVISAEGGLLALRKFQIPVAKVTTMDEVREILLWFQTKGTGSERIKTICPDSLSEIGEMSLAVQRGNYTDGRQIYGGLVEEMLPIIKGFRDLADLGWNVVFTAKQDMTKDEISGGQMIGPAMPGRELGKQLPYMFDELFYLGLAKDDKGDDFRYLRTAPDLQFDAKDRSGALDLFEPPDLAHIFTKIQGS